MACAYVRRGICDILFDDPDRPLTVPMFSDSQAAIAINTSDKQTKKSRHIERRYLYAKQECAAGKIKFFHVRDGFSLADIGTKNLSTEAAKYKLSLLEIPVTDHTILRPPRVRESKKGDELN